jgi:hypothetical protein
MSEARRLAGNDDRAASLKKGKPCPPSPPRALAVQRGRNEAEVEAEFKALEERLQVQIDADIAGTRKKLFDHMDRDVVARLKRRGANGRRRSAPKWMPVSTRWRNCWKSPLRRRLS